MKQPIIETDRFLIRALSDKDLHGMLALDSNANVHKYLGNKPISNLEEAAKNISSIQQQYKELGIGRWAVIAKNSGEFVGWTGFKFINELTNNHINYLDLGYRIKEDFWGQGIATETAKACLAFASKNFETQSIFAICDVANTSSKKVLKKCGFTQIETFNYGGSAHYWFEITKKDFL